MKSFFLFIITALECDPESTQIYSYKKVDSTHTTPSFNCPVSFLKNIYRSERSQIFIKIYRSRRHEIKWYNYHLEPSSSWVIRRDTNNIIICHFLPIQALIVHIRMIRIIKIHSLYHSQNFGGSALIKNYIINTKKIFSFHKYIFRKTSSDFERL